jgi:hypothetical protein
MTQIQLTDQRLNRALAELMGWKELVEYDDGAIYGFPPDDRWSNRVPNYCTDPAASLEVQIKAIEADHKNYILNLTEIVGAQHPTLDLYIAALLTASPRERAEAAYITLQGAT